MLCLPYYAYVLEIRAEQVLPGSKGGERDSGGQGTGGRNSPNNVCTCEYMNIKKIKRTFTNVPALGLPDVFKPFFLYIHD
jgi:hypothetical protein